MKMMILAQDFTGISSHSANWQYSTIASDYGLVLSKRQAIIWTSDA